MTTIALRRTAVSARRLVRARLRSRLGLSAGIAAAIAVAIGLLCGLPAAAGLASTAALRAAMPDPGTPEGYLQVYTRIASDADAQDAAARRTIAGLLGDDVEVETVRLGEAGTDLARVAWRITTSAHALDTAGFERLDRSLARVPEAIRESDAAQGGSVVSGGLADAVGIAATAASAAGALTPVPIVILAVLAWFAVLQLARLLGASRGREARVLSARGLSPGQDAGLSTIEAGAITVVGAVVGIAGAAAALGSTWGPDGISALVRTWPVALIAVIGLGATLVLAQLRSAQAAARAASVAGRIVRAASPGIAVLLVLVAAVLVWQAHELPPQAHDGWAVAVTVLAPTTGVAAVAVLAVMLFAPLSALVARAAARRRGVTPSYPSRQVARRLRSFSVAVALVSVAVAGAMLAGAYGATWQAASANSQRVAAGAPLRVALDAVTPADVTAAAGAEGVLAAAPALAVPVVAGDVSGTLVALPPDSMPEVLFAVPGAPEPADLAAEISLPATSVALPHEATGVRFTADVVATERAAVQALELRVWLVDASGTPIEVPLDVSVADAGGTFELTADAGLPPGRAPWRIVAVQAAQGRGWLGADVLLSGMTMSSTGPAGDTSLVEPALTARLHPGAAGSQPVRAAMVWTAAGDTPARIPAVVTSAFAQQLGLAAGDDVDVRVDGTGRTIAATVASITGTLPGIGARAGVLVSLDAAVDAASVTTTAADATGGAVTPPLADQVWASGDEDAAAALAATVGAPVVTAGSPADAVAGEVVTLWDAAAAGGALLAGVALVALLAALTVQRAGEVLVLRALGVPPGAQARMRALEAVVVVVLGAVLGVLGGAVLAALLVPRLAARAIPDVQLAPSLAFAPWPIVVCLAVIGLALTAAVAGAALAVRRQGASTRIEEAAP